MDKYVIAPPAGSINNGIGAENRPWKAGYFDTLPNWQEYLAESTGSGIVSGCEPSISGLTVTVAAGVVHLSDGTRKEIPATNITLDAADSTNPRIDLVYIDSTGTVAKITGTAAASPSAPALPSNGISVAQVSVAAGATTGTVNRVQTIAPNLANYGVVNVKDFGAVGDGVTDDTAAINQACQEGKMVIIPDGTYLIDCTMADRTSVNGGIMPKSNTTIIINNATMIVKANASSAYALFNLYKVDDVKIIGGKIIGDRATHIYGEGSNEWGHGIRIIGCNRIAIKGVTIEETIGDGIDITEFTGQEHSTDVLIENCIINHVRRNGVSIEHASNVKITQNKITNITGTAPQAAIDLEPNSFGYYRVHDIFIDKNVIADCVGDSVSVLEGKNIYITNNTLYNVDGGTMPASYSANEKIVYTGNTLIQNDGTVRKFFLGSNSVITGNYISGCTIYLTESLILNIKNILFNDNICDDCTFNTSLGGGEYDVICDNVKITNNIVTVSIEGNNIDLTQTSVKSHSFGTRDGFGGKKIYGINIDNNIFEFYGTNNILTPSDQIADTSSISLGMVDSTFKNNIIKNAPCAILVGNGKNTIIKGNKFYNLGFKKMYRALYIWNGTDRTVYFSNNDFIYDSDIMPGVIIYAERELYALNNTLKTNVQMTWFMRVTSGTNCCFLNNIAKNAVTTSVIHADGEASAMVEANNIM